MMRWSLITLLGILLSAVVFALATAEEITPKNAADYDPPREIDPVSLPPYRVEAPDILYLHMTKTAPLPSYHIGVYDVLKIHAAGTLPDQLIDGFYLVEGEGIVTLGPAYGTVSIEKLTASEAENAIAKKLQKSLTAPKVSVQVARGANDSPITGQYLVGPDGTINLRKYGTLHVAGKTVSEIRKDLNKQLSRYFDSPNASVEVRQWNSKVFYVITEGAGLGDDINIRRMPITGNDTVMDALSEVTGSSQKSNVTIWVARPAPDGLGSSQILPVDYEAITLGRSAATNYQLMPGDRVFVSENGSSQASVKIPNGTNESTQVSASPSNSRSISARQWTRTRRGRLTRSAQ